MDLYQGAQLVDGPRLVAPFSRSEIKVSFAGFDRASSSGPDDMGMSFYHAAWSNVSEDRDHLFLTFDSVADPGCLKTVSTYSYCPRLVASSVLEPTSRSPRKCDVKALCKFLTSRLKGQISTVFDQD